MRSTINDTIWKTQEIINLCPEHIASESEVYVKAIKNKIQRIKFLTERLDSLDSLSPTKLCTEDLIESNLEIEIYIESIASNLHSLADVIANIINVLVLKPLCQDLAIEKVNISSVENKLSKLTTSDNSLQNQYINVIVNQINNLCSLAEFIYISAFVNTIKHRNLVSTELRYEKTPNSEVAGYILNKFIYGSTLDPQTGDKIPTTHPKTRCKDFVSNHTDKIIEAIFHIGNSINNYCRALYIADIRRLS